MDISGSADVYLMPGDPVVNVRLPRMLNSVFTRFGVDAAMVPMHIGARDFPAWLRAAFVARNVKGLVIAPPHKPKAVELLDVCGLAARAAGSANIVRRARDGSLEGDLFDGEGILGALDRFGIPYRGKRVLILGAGVSGAAIGLSLAGGGTEDAAAFTAFYDPDCGKAAGIAKRLDSFYEAGIVAVESNDPAGFDLVINASTVGLQPSDPLPCDVSRMERHAAVFDILLRGQPTALVRAARARGLCAQPGFEMLIQQVPHYLTYFGLPEVARAVADDVGFLRELIYPAAFTAEIHAPPCYSAAGAGR